ncbi:12200_t:CDS:1, partial [Cetraspora pellucida]
NNTTTKGKSNANTRTSSNVIDLESSIKYKSNGLSSVISKVDYDSQRDGYFQNNNNNVKLAISHFVASAASVGKKKDLPFMLKTPNEPSKEKINN